MKFLPTKFAGMIGKIQNFTHIHKFHEGIRFYPGPKPNLHVPKANEKADRGFFRWDSQLSSICNTFSQVQTSIQRLSKPSETMWKKLFEELLGQIKELRNCVDIVGHHQNVLSSKTCRSECWIVDVLIELAISSQLDHLSFAFPAPRTRIRWKFLGPIDALAL